MSSGPSDQNLKLLQTWAPIVNVHPQEQYLPCSVEWYLQQCQLLDDSGASFFNNPPNILSSSASPPRTDTSVLADKKAGQRSNWFVSILDPTTTPSGEEPGQNSITAPCYGYVRQIFNGPELVYQDLDYWLFFAYNGNIFNLSALNGILTAIGGVGTLLTLFNPPLMLGVLALTAGTVAYVTTQYNKGDGVRSGLGLHQADWVLATVRLDGKGNFLGLNLEQHSNNVWVPYADITWNNGRPVIYAAQSSHELYPIAGTYEHIWVFALDNCEPSSPTNPRHLWDTQSTMVDVGWTSNIQDNLKQYTSYKSPFLSTLNQTIASNKEAGMVALAAQAQGGAFSIAIADWAGTDTSLTFWSSPVTGGSFEDPNAALEAPGLAVSAEGHIAIAYRHTDSTMWIRYGVIDEVNKEIDWWTEPVQYNGSGHADVAPALAFSLGQGDSIFLTEVHVLGSRYYWMAASMVNSSTTNQEGGTQTLNWWTNDQSLDDGRNNENGASVAVNNNGIFIEVHEPGNSAAVYRLGSIDPASQSITWYNTSGNPVGPGCMPTVSINDEGLVLVLASNNNQPVCYVGRIGSAGTGTTIEHWDTLAVGSFDYNNTIQYQVNLQEDETWIMLVPTTPNSASLIFTGTIIYDFSNWTPNSSAYWLKYSGHWGKPGLPPLIANIFVLEDGPPGPAARATFLTGPEQQQPASAGPPTGISAITAKAFATNRAGLTKKPSLSQRLVQGSSRQRLNSNVFVFVAVVLALACLRAVFGRQRLHRFD
jgi:hypothetical protein